MTNTNSMCMITGKACISELDCYYCDIYKKADEYLEPEYNPVTRPEHYTNGNIEAIDDMIQIFGKEAVAHFCAVNVWKYLFRRKHKGNEEQDIQKALWYFDKHVELMGDVYETGRSNR